MALCNAVLIRHKTGYTWVTDSVSIGMWGRIEGFLSVGEMDDPAAIQQVGIQYLEAHSQPTVSHVVEIARNGPVAGEDFDLGDTLTAGGTIDLRCVGITYALQPDGTLRAVPELSSPRDEFEKQTARTIDRMIANAGGTSGASAPPISTGTSIKAGRVSTVKLDSWSWSDPSELDDPWDPEVEPGDGGSWGQPFEIEEPLRLCEWTINCEWQDRDEEQVTDGITRFQLYLDDAPLGDLPFIITIGETEKEGRQPIYGPAVVMPGQLIRPVCLDNGGHHSGSITVHATDPP